MPAAYRSTHPVTVEAVDEHADHAQNERRRCQPVRLIPREAEPGHDGREEVVHRSSRVCGIQRPTEQPSLWVGNSHHEALLRSHFGGVILLLLVALVVPAEPCLFFFIHANDLMGRVGKVQAKDHREANSDDPFDEE